MVLLAGRDRENDFRKAAQAVRGQLSDLAVAFRVVWVDRVESRLPAQVARAEKAAAEHKALAVVWCDFSSINLVFLYLARSPRGRILVRKVTETEEGAHGRFEAIGAIVRGSVGAILKGGRIGIGVPVLRGGKGSRAAEQPAVKQEAKLRKTSVFVRSGYRVVGFSAQNRLLHAGLATVGFSFLRFWSVEAGYVFAPSVTVRDHGITLMLHNHDLVVGAGFDWPMGRFSLGGRAAFVTGFRDRRSVADSAQVTAAPGGVDVTLGMEASVRSSFRIKPWLTVFAEAGGTALIWNANYRMTVGGEEVTILRPWVVQPFGMVGLGFRLY